MIQRKQTLFLLVALLLSILCLNMQIGSFVPKAMGGSGLMFNLWIVQPNGAHDMSVWMLFASLLITCPLTLLAIFMYKNRKLQRKICTLNMLLVVVWYVCYVLKGFVLVDKVHTDFHISFAAVLPLIAFILYLLANRAILADERLVRAADRIR
jgi:hypothetical protein